MDGLIGEQSAMLVMVRMTGMHAEAGAESGRESRERFEQERLPAESSQSDQFLQYTHTRIK
jgi:hypothetical protein